MLMLRCKVDVAIHVVQALQINIDWGERGETRFRTKSNRGFVCTVHSKQRFKKL